MARRTRTGLHRHRLPQQARRGLAQVIEVAVPAAAGQIGLQGQQGVHVAGAPGLGWLRLEKPVVLVQILVGGGVIAPRSPQASQAALQLELAHVAAAALGQGVAYGLFELRHQGRQVFVHQLLLQGHGGGADEHARVALERQRQRRRAVGERFAHPGAGLDDGQGPLRLHPGQSLRGLQRPQIGLTEGLRHLFGHQALPRPRPQPLVALQQPVVAGQRLLRQFGFIHKQQSVAQAQNVQKALNLAS